ncbi:MAG: zf-TFIIB domain-containing protein [Fimbriimonas sp.]
MLCPIDQTPLVIAQKNGVEIDYCPQCRGVWLDRGELEKIMDRSLDYRSRDRDDDDDDRHRRTYGDPRYDEQYHRKRKKESWLGDLFDF